MTLSQGLFFFYIKTKLFVKGFFALNIKFEVNLKIKNLSAELYCFSTSALCCYQTYKGFCCKNKKYVIFNLFRKIYRDFYSKTFMNYLFIRFYMNVKFYIVYSSTSS